MGPVTMDEWDQVNGARMIQRIHWAHILIDHVNALAQDLGNCITERLELSEL